MSDWVEFIHYWHDRIDKNLSVIEGYSQYSDDDEKEYDNYRILMSGYIRDYGLCYVVEDPENDQGMSFIPVGDVPESAPNYIQKGRLCRTPMIEVACYAARQEGEGISQYFYNIISCADIGWAEFHQQLIYYLYDL